MSALIPGLYVLRSFLRRQRNGGRMAKWVKANHPEVWSRLPWIAKHAKWPTLEGLITKGEISGKEIDEYRAFDASLERKMALGMLIMGVLLVIGLIAGVLDLLFSMARS